MTILGTAFFGVLLFAIILGAVALFGAAANKWEQEVAEQARREREKGPHASDDVDDDHPVHA
ncbi:hypothetical protein LZ198_24960 [Myxococcus sp. K15C18031901]|uniref:hypothetical protein n=1 Tax=Myxococcus dinghuensis TaxID=2906761 RepID=UPI0020A7FEEE|nr:hypothetical protein [Myxococcus dinghuensis]MCP3102124.1 hypothetical protein [Myxococcus dinghuensis]